MTTTNITNFRKNAFDYVEQTIKYNQPINITTKDGNAVLLSEEDYSGIRETLYLVSAPGMREKIMDVQGRLHQNRRKGRAKTEVCPSGRKGKGTL